VKHLLRMCLIGITAWLLQAGTSYAEYDWLDKLSGPAFHGFTYRYRFLCVSKVGNGYKRAVLSPIEDFSALTIRRIVKRKLWPEVAASDSDEQKAKTYCQIDAPEIRVFAAVSSGVLWSHSNELFVETGQVYLFPIDGTIGYRTLGIVDLTLRSGIDFFTGKDFPNFTSGSFTPAVTIAPFSKPDLHPLRFSVGWTRFVHFSDDRFCSQVMCDADKLAEAENNKWILRLGVLYGF